MITELNTIFQLRRDTLDKWNTSQLVLQPGELAVAYVDVETLDQDGNVTYVPTVLLKVGENVAESSKTFSELPFISAIAADVSAWAKQAGINIKDDELGSLISDVEWIDDTLVIHRTSIVFPKTVVEASNGVKVNLTVDGENKTYTVKGNFGFVPTLNNNMLQIVDNTTNEVITEFDATEFIKDGMLTSAEYDDTTCILTLTWNTDSGITPTTIDLSGLVDSIATDTWRPIYINDNSLSDSESLKLANSDDGNILVTKTDDAVKIETNISNFSVDHIQSYSDSDRGDITFDGSGTNISSGFGIRLYAAEGDIRLETGSSNTNATYNGKEIATVDHFDGLCVWRTF